MMKLAFDEAQDTSAPQGDCLSLIDLDRYPINQPASPVLRAAIARARAGLEQDGCARLSGFICPQAWPQLEAETTALMPLASHSTEQYTPYGSGPDESFPPNHPRRRAHRTTSGSVTRDRIPADSAIQRLYCSSHLQGFVAACLDIDVIYPFADPMRGLIINSMEEGNSLGWHFDANEFIVSLMTRRADAGGLFEYCPGIRAPGDENFSAVEAVLDGRSDLVKGLDLRVGDLQIFKGRYSLHRVEPIVKGIRHTAIFGYSRKPGFIGSVASTMKIYGRVMQEHIDAENNRHGDGLAD